MVKKTKRFGKRSGNTIKKSDLSVHSRYGYVHYKLINTLGNTDLKKIHWIFRRKNVVLYDGMEWLALFEAAFDDRHLDSIYRPWHLYYSLDKHKRWTLSSWILNNIESLSKEDFRVVLSERENVHYWHKRMWNDCVQYVDSKTPLPVATPTKSASYFCDLRSKCLGGGHIEKKTVMRKRKRNNVHPRGIQRKYELQQKMEEIENRQNYNAEQLLMGNDNEDVVELRYEVSIPGKLSRFYIRHDKYWDRYRDLTGYVRYSTKKSLFKQKAFVNGKFPKSFGKKSLEIESLFTEKETSMQYGFSEYICLTNEFHPSDEVVYVYDFEKDEMCGVKKKNTLEVFLSDCLKISEQKPKSEKLRKRKDVQKSPDIDRKDHIVYIKDLEGEEADDDNCKEETCFTLHPEKTSVDSEACEGVLPISAIFSLKKTEMKEFLQGFARFYSPNAYPTIYAFPSEELVKYDRSKGKSSSSTLCYENELYNINCPVLVLQETIGTAMSSSNGGISRYRLTILGNEEVCDNVEFRYFIKKISSVDEIISLADELMSHDSMSLSIFTKYGKEIPPSEAYIQEPAFKWLPRVPYKITTIKQAYMDLLECGSPKNHQQKKNKLPILLSSVTESSTREYDCGVCSGLLYKGEDSTEGLIILPCHHSFCRNCLSKYAVENIRTSTRFISCLEYKCVSKIDPLVIMSVVPYHLFRKWVHRQQEQAVMSTGIWKWCPNKTCDFILSLVPEDPEAVLGIENISLISKNNIKRMGVKCLCQTEFCMECGEEPHWPAICQQMKAYVKILNTTKDVLRKNDTTKTLTVNVKTCPRCNSMAERISKKCSWVMCICGYDFCWLCLKDYFRHKCKAEVEVPAKPVHLVNIKQLKFGLKYLDQAYAYRGRLLTLIKWKKVMLKEKEDIETSVRSDICSTLDHYKLQKLQKQLHKKNAQVEHVCVLIKCMKIMEKVFVSLSDIPRKSPPGKEFNSLASQVDFIFSRTSELLRSSDNSEIRVRIGKLQCILLDKIKTMALMSVYLQQRRLHNTSHQTNIKFDYCIRYY